MRVVAALLLLCGTLNADPPRVLVPCHVLSVHDGDTITVDVVYPWSVKMTGQSVRMQGYDAWEVTRTRRTVNVSDAELERGKAARDALAKLLKDADGVYLSPADQRDPYGRLPAFVVVWDEGKLIEVADWMAKRGHTRK